MPLNQNTPDELRSIDALWNYDDPAASEQAFRAALPAVADSKNQAYCAVLLTQLARAQGLQRDFAAAHTTLDQAQELITENIYGQIRHLLERGRVYNSAGDRARAQPLFAEAWETARNAGEDALAIDAAHMLAIVAPLEEQHGWNLRALDLAEHSTDPGARRWRGSLLNNIGWTYQAEGDYEAALEAFERALAAREEAGDIGAIRIARWCVAHTLRSLGRIEEARTQQQALFEELEAAGKSDGYVNEELGECLLAQGDADAARPHFARAYSLLSQDAWLVESEPERIERLRRLAEKQEIRNQ